MAQALAAAREENQTLVRHSLAVQEDERRHLARELHDEFGQCLTAIKVMSATLRQPGEPPESPAGQIMALCDRLFTALRALLGRLRPMLLDDLGLTAAVEDLAGQWQARHPELAIHLECAAVIDDMSRDQALQIYRIIQECLTNVVKHAGAGNCWIRLSQEPGPSLAVLIRDDGRGFDPGRPHGGFGLSGIRERIAGLGGQWTLETRPGHGVAIRIRLPCLSGST
jgi:two-component system sensor histidine kinase UhpB